jgi:hypothetical protein
VIYYRGVAEVFNTSVFAHTSTILRFCPPLKIHNASSKETPSDKNAIKKTPKELKSETS